MKVFIEQSVFDLAPQFMRYVLVARNVQNATHNDELLGMLRHEEAAIRNNPEFASYKTHPRVMAWQNMFAAFDVNPNKCPPSMANLIKRVYGGKEMPYINNLVCAFNIVSMRHIIPAGGDDLSTVQGNIGLVRAAGDETYIPLGSAGAADAIEHPKAGEVILMDTGSKNVLCRAWCWKNGDTTKIQETTTDVAINLDILPPIDAAEGATIAATVKQLLETHCKAQVEVHCLTAQNPSIEI